MTTMQLSADDDDVADSWEDESFSVQLAHTPQKGKPAEDTTAEPPSPSHLKIYDSSFLLKFRNTPRSEKVADKIKDTYDLPPQKFEDSPPPVSKFPEKVTSSVQFSSSQLVTSALNVKPVSPAMDLRTVLGNTLSYPTSPSLPTSSFPAQQTNPTPSPEIKPPPQTAPSVNRSTPPPPASPSLPTPAGPEFQPKPIVERVAFNSDLSRKSSNPFRKQPTDSITATTKKLQGVLNKLTPEKYERLFQQIVDALFAFKVYDLSDFSSMEVLDNMIGIVFECALAQPGFSCMYADLCRHLCDVTSLASSQAASIGKKMDAKEREEKEKEKEVEYRKYFRQRLLNRCQKEFESAPQKAPEGITKEEKEEYTKKQKMRASGNVKFVAELFRRKLLTENIIHTILAKLVLAPENQQTTAKSKPFFPKTEEIEFMCTLLSCAGKELDRKEAKDRMDKYFKEMDRLQGCHPDPRTRFMLMNAVDLRKNNWVDKEKMCIESTPRGTPNFVMPALSAKPLTAPPPVSSLSSSPPAAEKEPACPPPQLSQQSNTPNNAPAPNWNVPGAMHSSFQNVMNSPEFAGNFQSGPQRQPPMAQHIHQQQFSYHQYAQQQQQQQQHQHQQQQHQQQHLHTHQHQHQHHFNMQHQHQAHQHQPLPMGMHPPMQSLNQPMPYVQGRGAPQFYGRGYSTPNVHTHQPPGVSRADNWKKK